MTIPRINFKKELSIALKEMQSSGWFAELSADERQDALQMTKACYTPPGDMENTLLNIAIDGEGLSDAWKSECLSAFPWADSVTTKGEVGLRKRAFFSERCSASTLDRLRAS